MSRHNNHRRGLKFLAHSFGMPLCIWWDSFLYESDINFQLTLAFAHTKEIYIHIRAGYSEHRFTDFFLLQRNLTPAPKYAFSIWDSFFFFFWGVGVGVSVFFEMPHCLFSNPPFKYASLAPIRLWCSYRTVALWFYIVLVFDHIVRH
jgi:hypothetical protein